MINIELKNQPISDTDKYIRLENLPTAIYGAVVKDEYDDQRLVNDQADYFKHTVKDTLTGLDSDVYFRAVQLQQPLLALKILTDYKKLKPEEENHGVEYEHLLSKFNVSCSDNLHMLYDGCLPIDGSCVRDFADRNKLDVLSYNFEQFEWYNRFSSLDIYILY